MDACAHPASGGTRGLTVRRRGQLRVAQQRCAANDVEDPGRSGPPERAVLVLETEVGAALADELKLGPAKTMVQVAAKLIDVRRLAKRHRWRVDIPQKPSREAAQALYVRVSEAHCMGQVAAALAALREGQLDAV